MRPILTGNYLDHGSNRDVDQAAEILTTIRTRARQGIILKADASNAGIVYVGNSDVTPGNAAATDGFPLAASEQLVVEIEDARQIYVVASANDQVIYWLAV